MEETRLIKKCTRNLENHPKKYLNPLTDINGNLPIEQFDNCQRDGKKSNCKHCTARDYLEIPNINSKYKRLGVKIGERFFTQDDYERIIKEQNYKCACCGSKEPKGKGKIKFVVDHNHITEQFRGLICYPCNIGIGNLGDSILGIKNAYEYLLRCN